MRRKLRKFACAVLAAAMMLSAAPASAVAPPTQPVTIRVGLNYGSSALPGANLDNNVGSGYRFGYFDATLQFVQLGYTDVGLISVIKDQNVYYDGKNYTDASSGIVVGGYHLQLPNTYPDFVSARAAALQVVGGYPAWVNGAYCVRVGSYTSLDTAAAAQSGLVGATVVGNSSYGVSVVKTGTNTILFQFDGGADLSLGVKPGLEDSVQTATWFRNIRYYGSFRYQRFSGGDMAVVNILPLEDYLKGVVSTEMSDSWPLEALKAQAVASRSYVMRSSGKHKSLGFDVCASTDCQAYTGLKLAGPNINRAVDDTAGIYATYNGEIAETVYFSNDGGATEDVKNVWGSSIPYLAGVTDPYEASVTASIPNHRWTVTLSKETIAEKVRAKGYTGCTDVVDFYVSERSQTGNVIAFTVVDSAGKKYTFSNKVGEQCRIMFGFRSINYTIGGGSGDATGGGTYFVNDSTNTLPAVTGAYAVDGSGNVSQISATPYAITSTGTEALGAPAAGNIPTGSTAGTGSATYTVSGSGWGHLVGMSQWGAHAMAKQGKTYDEILKFYYAGIRVG